MTVVIQGITHPVSSEGSRLSWATPSLVHEGLGYRAIEPDRIQGDAVLLPHACTTAQSRDHVTRSSMRALRPQPATLAPAWPPSRPLRVAEGDGLRPALTAPAAGALTQTAVGTKKRPRSNQETRRTKLASRKEAPPCPHNVTCR